MRDGQHLVFGVYLLTWTELYLLNFPIKMHHWYELNIDRCYHVLACFQTWNYFKGIMKQLLNSAFVGYEEFCRSRRVLYTSADNTLLDLRILTSLDSTTELLKNEKIERKCFWATPLNSNYIIGCSNVVTLYAIPTTWKSGFLLNNQ